MSPSAQLVNGHSTAVQAVGRLSEYGNSNANISPCGVLLLLSAIAAFVAQSEAVSIVQGPQSFNKPWFLLYVAHGCYVIILPLQYLYCRIVYHDTPQDYVGRITRVAEDLPANDGQGTYRMLIRRTLCLNAFFTAGAYSWYLSVSRIALGELTAIYNSSCFFTYLLSVLLLNERIRRARLCAVFICVAGIIAISWADPKEESSENPSSQSVGYMFAISSSFWVAGYEVFYKKFLVPFQPSMLLSLHITSLIGLTTLLFGVPPIFLFHYTGWESFEIPDLRSCAVIAVVAALGLVFNATFMLAIAFCGPLMAAIGIMLTIPVMSSLDFFVAGVDFGWNTVIGSLAIIAGYGLLLMPSPDGESYCEDEQRPLVEK
ncbi:uncharacterized protein SPPG_02639 [Spizellomyces punctatus DAOM BR117]|uniref:EamA domain-containing protein n=1 Tax=Spizellomyces punctatus (strain DAOM BR117) TaxID=645134 RepID=A0A0L0HL41_SPIPD|nr:uncharacterized protein SPPG_02639 [Spizellomyces punctatus DAOM BR117]KND02146.1 hypothetical protein SPPG_02639 [Spizellomyces punctatus DAOM BR117]|eukprot:XP_016610185.1 hypothetical protein SPPG_02639 [Spizellomyces punctatus DAOM BR117]